MKETILGQYEVEEVYVFCISVRFPWPGGQHSERGGVEFYLQRRLFKERLGE